jgi:hypothetical protein
MANLADIYRITADLAGDDFAQAALANARFADGVLTPFDIETHGRLQNVPGLTAALEEADVLLCRPFPLGHPGRDVVLKAAPEPAPAKPSRTPQERSEWGRKMAAARKAKHAQAAEAA